MHISIAAHGRFHAFDLAAALLGHGMDVRLLTNYPRRVAARWLPAERVQTLRRHGLLSRAARHAASGEPPEQVEAALKQMFGRWAARRHIAEVPDVVHCWSGVAEESLRACADRAICTVARGSAHIRTQYELLAAEQVRTGCRLEKPSAWIIAREEREYDLAFRVIVPSSFARRSFIERGHDPGKIAVVNLSWRARGFEADEAIVARRAQRLRSGAPLRVLYTGALSYRKGMHDMRAVLGALGPRMSFRLVGPLLDECADFAREAARVAQVQAAVPESHLPEVYAWGDVFLLPTIEDGFAVVLAQAQAAGLPLIATTNCGAPDIIEGGGQGFIVPVRTPSAIIERLEWCNTNREELARMVERLYEQPPRRSWDDAASDFIRVVSA